MNNDYIFESLELHLFFSRIMKEHALFLEAGFQLKDTSHIAKARWYRVQFEALLREIVEISGGLIRGDILQSGEIVTCYTPFAEQKTQQLTGIMIDGRITAMEQHLKADCDRCVSHGLERRVQRINQRAACLLDGLIAFKENILQDVRHCCLFTVPLSMNLKKKVAYVSRTCGMWNCSGIKSCWNMPYLFAAFWTRQKRSLSKRLTSLQMTMLACWRKRAGKIALPFGS